MKTIAFQIVSLLWTLALVSAETIQLEPTQGILIPAPVARTLRIARNAYGGGAAYSSPAAPAPAGPSYSAPAAQSYSSASIPAPPCPRNYLFSCQPSLSPVACSAPSSGYQAPAPSSSYSAPSSSYSAPSSSYSAPSSSYSAPSSSYSAPSSSYSAPSSSYSAPAAPVGAYSHQYPQYALPFVQELY